MQITVNAYLCVTSDVAVHVQQPHRGRFLGAADILPASTFHAVWRHQSRRRGVAGSRDIHGKGQGQGQGRQPTAVVLVVRVLKTSLMNIYDSDDVIMT